MGFRFQRRLNLGSGLGLNLGKTGASVSGRAFFGSVGTGGFSVRSGLPGFSYRKSFGRGGAGLVVGLVVTSAVLVVNLTALLVVLGVKLFIALVQVCWVLVVAALNLLLWMILTLSDLAGYLISQRRTTLASGLSLAPSPASSDDTASPPSAAVPLLPIHGRPASPPPANGEG